MLRYFLGDVVALWLWGGVLGCLGFRDLTGIEVKATAWNMVPYCSTGFSGRFHMGAFESPNAEQDWQKDKDDGGQCRATFRL